jgi:integral membrane sensor domain MASE1
MSQRTTIGWSLFSSGITAIVLTILPYPSWWWGVALIIIGVIVMSRRVV